MPDLSAFASWHFVVIVLLVFGFAPGAVLRIVVKAWPKGDPMRGALRGDFAVRSHWERPFFVAAQIDNALFDGLGARRSLQSKTTGLKTMDNRRDPSPRLLRSMADLRGSGVFHYVDCCRILSTRQFVGIDRGHRDRSADLGHVHIRLARHQTTEQTPEADCETPTSALGPVDQLLVVRPQSFDSTCLRSSQVRPGRL
jgi:hypothetical protein